MRPSDAASVCAVDAFGVIQTPVLGYEMTKREEPTASKGPEPFLVPYEGQAEVLRSLLEPMLWQVGIELVQMYLVRSQHKDAVRLFVDRRSDAEHDQSTDDVPGGGISMAELERANRMVSDLLDVEDSQRGLFKKPYDLEVGSPGVDRPLTKKSHYHVIVGKLMRAKTRGAIDGARSFKGRVTAVGEDTVTLNVDGREATLPLDDITQANVIFEMEAPQEAARKGKPAKGQAKRHANVTSEADDGVSAMAIEPKAAKPTCKPSDVRPKPNARSGTRVRPARFCPRPPVHFFSQIRQRQEMSHGNR